MTMPLVPVESTWLDEKWDDEFEGWHIKDVGEWRVFVLPMIYNDRVVLAHKDDHYGYSAGWCYDKGGVAVLAALAWDVENERRPAGFIKEACDARPLET